MCQILSWRFYNASDFVSKIPGRSKFEGNFAINNSTIDFYDSVKMTNSAFFRLFQKEWFWTLEMIRRQNLKELFYNPSNIQWDFSQRSAFVENFAFNKSPLEFFYSVEVTYFAFSLLFQTAGFSILKIVTCKTLNEVFHKATKFESKTSQRDSFLRICYTSSQILHEILRSRNHVSFRSNL